MAECEAHSLNREARLVLKLCPVLATGPVRFRCLWLQAQGKFVLCVYNEITAHTLTRLNNVCIVLTLYLLLYVYYLGCVPGVGGISFRLSFVPPPHVLGKLLFSYFSI
jgi:hypothetical protein